MPSKVELQEEQIRLAEELLFSGKRLPSFAKALYFGLFDAKRVLPFPHPSEGDRKRVDEFCVRLNRFCDANLDPDWIDRHAEFPPQLVTGLGELGVLGCTIPKEYGGLEFSQYGYCRIVEEVARRCASTALFINAHQSIGLKALLLFGTQEQRDRWLPPLARGECLAAFALTEPNAGSDAAGLETRAVYDPEKNTYRITGEKQWITNGSIAQILTVMAKTEVDTPKGKRNKVTAFLVTPDMPGFQVTAHALEKVGMRGSTTSKLAFDNMEVPAENILGKLGEGLKLALTILDYGRTTFGASCTGSAKELVERAIKHACTRHQFQRPLASFALVKQKIAVMSALVYAMESATYMTAGLLDRGEEDFMLETAIIKVFTSETQWQILYDTMQILGGRSLFTDAPYERMMRDARLNMIGEGSNDVLRAFIGLVGLRDVGMELKGVADAAKSPLAGLGTMLGFGKKSLSKVLRSPQVPIRSSQLAGEAAQLGSSLRRFGLANQRLLARRREDIIEAQLDLNRVATVAMALYAVTATLSRLDHALTHANGRRESVETDLAAGRLYCKMAFDTIDHALHAMFHNFDVDTLQHANQLTGLDA